MQDYYKISLDLVDQPENLKTIQEIIFINLQIYLAILIKMIFMKKWHHP